MAALTRLRELLQGDVGVASQLLKALVGEVVIEARKVEGKAKPELVARFTKPRTLVVPLARKCHRAASDVPVTPPADLRPPQAS